LAGDSVLDEQRGNGFDAIPTDVSVIPTLSFDDSHPLMSMVTMIAPSPDWFSGVNDFDMRTTSMGGAGTDPVWLGSITLDTFPWDSGTDSGDTYLSGNADQVGGTVQQLTVNNLPATNVFLSPDGTTVLPVARMTCVLNVPVSQAPSLAPSNAPTSGPTDSSNAPTTGPTSLPTTEPTSAPTSSPTSSPTSVFARLHEDCSTKTCEASLVCRLRNPELGRVCSINPNQARKKSPVFDFNRNSRVPGAPVPINAP